jgi:hypothetical protein
LPPQAPKGDVELLSSLKKWYIIFEHLLNKAIRLYLDLRFFSTKVRKIEPVLKGNLLNGF